MTTSATDPADLLAVRELADDILSAGTEPVLDIQQVGLAFDPTLWATLAESGLTLLTTPESRGGTGAGLPELAVVLESSGYHAAPVPLGEHDLLAAWLLGAANLPLGQAVLTAAATPERLRDGRLATTLRYVPWAGAAETLVVAGDGFVAAVPRRDVTLMPTADLAGQPHARVDIDVQLDADQYRVVDAQLLDEFRLRGGYIRAQQTCGALSRILELTCAHAQQREQFGRPIAKFQAVQALIAAAAGAVALARTAAQFATQSVHAHGFDSPIGRFAVAVAKIESARAATLVARNAHQVHGAIGFTLDHRLRHFTTRAMAWRADYGAQRDWQHMLGRQILDSTDDAWSLVTGLSSSVVPARHK